MTPNDLREYLEVLKAQDVGAAILEFDSMKLSVTFMPTMPVPPGAAPTPGGWKSLDHLDDPASLHDYTGALPE